MQLHAVRERLLLIGMRFGNEIGFFEGGSAVIGNRRALVGFHGHSPDWHPATDGGAGFSNRLAELFLAATAGNHGLFGEGEAEVLVPRIF